MPWETPWTSPHLPQLSWVCLCSCSRRTPWHGQLVGRVLPLALPDHDGTCQLLLSDHFPVLGVLEGVNGPPVLSCPSTQQPSPPGPVRSHWVSWPLQPWLPERHQATEQHAAAAMASTAASAPLSCWQSCCLERGKAPSPPPHQPLLQGKSWSPNAMAQKTLSAPAARADTISRAGPGRGTVPPTISVKTVSAPCAHRPWPVGAAGAGVPPGSPARCLTSPMLPLPRRRPHREDARKRNARHGVPVPGWHALL